VHICSGVASRLTATVGCSSSTTPESSVSVGGTRAVAAYPATSSARMSTLGGAVRLGATQIGASERESRGVAEGAEEQMWASAVVTNT
jgi:hypothetical protein